MSDEATRAAERLRIGATAYNADTDIGTISWQQLSDFVTLANAYLREHPADDAEPVTEEWVASINPPCYWDPVANIAGQKLVCGTQSNWALGVDMKEQGR